MGRIKRFASKEEWSEPSSVCGGGLLAGSSVWACDCSGSVMCGQLTIDVRLGSHAHFHVLKLLREFLHVRPEQKIGYYNSSCRLTQLLVACSMHLVGTLCDQRHMLRVYDVFI